MPKTCSAPTYPFRAKLQTDTATDDNPAESFANTVVNMPVDIVAISGQETFRGRTLESNVDYVVTTPYRKGVDPKQRIVPTTGIFKDKTLNIEHVHPIQKPGTRPTLELYCTELQS